MFGLNRTYTIEGKRQSRTPGGSMDWEPYNIATGVRGTIQEMKSAEKLARYGAVSVVAAKLWMEISAPLEVQAHIKDELSGEVWRVVDITNAAGRYHHWEATVERAT